MKLYSCFILIKKGDINPPNIQGPPSLAPWGHFLDLKKEQKVAIWFWNFGCERKFYLRNQTNKLFKYILRKTTNLNNKICIALPHDLF